MIWVAPGRYGSDGSSGDGDGDGDGDCVADVAVLPTGVLASAIHRLFTVGGDRVDPAFHSDVQHVGRYSE